MSKLPVYVSESDFEKYILPQIRWQSYADSGFDVKSFIEYIEQKHPLITNIPKNQRNTKKINQEHRYLSEYIYSFRFKIETIFAWLDSYKRILIRFEQRAKHFKSWLLIASFLINLRTILN